MGKVYRLHEGAEGTGWFASKIFNDEELETILTDGKEVSNSIPSPFARIDLVNEAFRWAAQNNLEGSKAQHLLVSDALDIGQLIFYSNKFKGKVEIVDYSPKQRISEYFGNVDNKHRQLAKTFDVYWEQDAGVYNFDEIDKIYLVLFNKEILGATSPKSLFFSAPFKSNIRDEVTIQRATGKYFGSKAVPLHQREWDFIEYLFVLAKQPQFADYFPDFYEYMERIKEALDIDRRKEINGLTKDHINEYDKCHVTGEATNYCKVINCTLHTANEKINSIENESDFVIYPDYEVEGKRPLVLPNGTFSEEWVFTTKDILWDSNKYRGKIPEKNLEFEKSRLPIQGDNYPWLSIGNFLTESIVELPYEIDSDNYRIADGSAGKKYLLPLTETFFNYFSADNVSEFISIKEMNQGTVIVSLSIKTRGGYVKFEKKYRTEDKVNLKLHLSILPFVKIENQKIPIRYNVGIIDADLRQNHQNRIDLSFFKKGELIESDDFAIRAPGELKVKSYYTSTESYFDSIKLLFNGQPCGFIVPNMRSYVPNSEQSEFSVDFGTTNTHIEYSINKRAEESLKFEPNSIWASLLNRRSKIDPEHEATEQLFETEMVPYSLGHDISETGFPLRTALVENKSDSQLHSKKQLYKHANNFLLYETKNIRGHLDLFTNLKWGNLNSEINFIRVQLYIEYLIRLIKYKALILNLNLENLKITWFYPISMSSYQRGRLASVWEEKLKDVFGSTYNPKNVTSLPESVGPYYYYYEKHSLPGATLSIDIGGGSTDVSYYDEGIVKFITSFRFAGDTLFGDGYGRQPNRNGFIKTFKDKALKQFEDETDKRAILETIVDEHEASKDFSSYLFSQSAKDSSIDYASWIQNDKFLKLSVLVFHGAIAYYIAKLLKHRSEFEVKNILFSGSASKTIKLIDSSGDYSKISNLYGHFLEQVAGINTKSLNTQLSDIPKELTAKGGLMQRGVNDDFEELFWIGSNGKFEQLIDSNKLKNVPKLSDTQDVLGGGMKDSVSEFYLLMDQFLDMNNVEKDFGINRSAIIKFQEVRLVDIESFLSKGIKEAIDNHHESENDLLEESLFFYPMVGEIHKLAFELSELNNS